MNVLSIGTDRAIVDPNSASARRQAAYGEKLGQLHMILFTSKSAHRADVFLSPSTHIHATNSWSRLLYGLDALRIARKLPKADVVTVQDPFETGLIGWVIARFTGAALHVQVHTDFLSPAYARHSMLNRMRRIIAMFVIPRADRIRVVSGRIKDAIEKTYAPRAPITVLPIFVDIATLRNVRAEEIVGRFSNFDTRLLIVSRLESEKNVSLALESFAAINHPKTCLIIVGDGKERKKLERLVVEHGLAGRVFFEGSTPALPYYAIADLVLVPSRYEGYGLVIVEALAAGRPVLATDVGIAREAGAIVTDEAQFTNALTAWFKNGERAGVLHEYPYQSFGAYVDAYCEDLQKTAIFG